MPACVSVHHVCAVSLEAIGDIGSPGTGVTDGCEPLCGAGN